ncbi:MAG: cysteine desulfurase family protein [Polyangiales bacterium]
MDEAPIYMDHHATTPVDPRVLAEMLPFFTERFGNAASRSHGHGKVARDAAERGRAQLATLLGSKPEELVFTSGATESDNLAIRGVAEARKRDGKHIVTVRTEHRAVLDSCAELERLGWRVTRLDVDEDGMVSPEAVAAALTDETVLLSVMLANNEIGVVQRLADIGSVAKERGVTFHCDAAQGLGYVPFSIDEMHIDLASVSAHKMYGPKGVGALYVREALLSQQIPSPQMYGGGHERGLRSGTLNVPGIVGFGAAAAIMKNEGAQEAERIQALRDRLKDRLLSVVQEAHLNGAAAPRHPGNLNLSFGYVDGAGLLLELGRAVSVSSGAACSTATPGPSYVLEAMGIPKSWSTASVRFGLGRDTTVEEVEAVGDAVIETVARLRERSPLWNRRESGKPVDW